MAKKLKAILRTVFLVAVALVLGVNVYLWNARSLMGNALPMPFGYGAAVVLSGSMETTFSTGDLILVKEQEEFQVDDIVVFQTGNVLVVHRIVELRDGTVITRGDANNVEDAPIRPEYIKGVVFGHIPQVGTLIRLMKTPAVTLALVAAAILMVEVSFRKEMEKGDDELEKIKEEIRKLKEEQM